MAWLKSASYTPNDIISYWLTRLTPLADSGCVVAICNRTGADKEGGAQFCGTSCITKFTPGRPSLYARTGLNEDALVISTVTLP